MLRWAFMLSLVLLVLVVGRLAHGQEIDEADLNTSAYTCTVQVEYEDTKAEHFASAATMEEASDQAIDAACALVCVELKGGGDDDDASGDDDSDDDASGGDDSGDSAQKSDAPTGSTPAEEDPHGIEECIAICYDDAEVLGTLCVDESEKAVYVDGSFDED